MLKYCLAPAVAILLLPPAGLLAQQAPAGQAQPQAQHEQRADQRERMDGEVLRADRLIGQAVYDRQNNRVGRIDDLALNVNDKKVAYAVVSRGGLWGIGAEQVAVKWQQIQPDQAERVVRFDGTGADLERAQRIDTRDAWPTEIRPGERAAERPVATAGEDVAPHNILSASRLVGMDVRNQQGDRLGQIDDVVLQRDGSISYAVIAHGGFLGVGHNYVAVPWDRLNIHPRQEQVMLNVTQQQLEAAPRFEHRDDRWPGRVDWPFGDR